MSEFIVKNRRGIFVLPVEDVIYMEKNLRKISLFVTDFGDASYRKIEFYGRFEDVIPQLDERFMYCHRSYIINMDKIVWMQGCEIFVRPDIRIHMEGREKYLQNISIINTRKKQRKNQIFSCNSNAFVV